MKCSSLHPVRCLFLSIGFFLACIPVLAQAVNPTTEAVPPTDRDRLPKISRPINLDEALQEPASPDRAASYYHFALAKWNERNGDLGKALFQMQEALKYNPGSSAINMELAKLFAMGGNIPEAISYAEEASRIDPEDPDPHWVLADIYFNSRMQNDSNEGLIKAVQELEKYQELDPENGNVYFVLGGAYFELNQPEKAIQAYEKFQNIVDTTDNGYIEIAKYYLRNNDNEKAVEYLEKAIELQPESAESLWLLGDAYGRLRRSQDAAATYKKLVQVQNDNINVKQRLTVFLVDSGEYQSAIDLLGEIIQAVPEDIDAQILLGRAQIGLKEYAKAIETLRSVETKNSEMKMSTQFYLGIAYKNNGDYAEAADIFKALLDNTFSDSEEDQANRLLFQRNLVSIYLEAGENDKAIAIGKKEFEKNPNDIRMGSFYAQIMADADNADAAVAILSTMLESNPSEVDLYIHQSQIYLEAERYSEAEKIIRKAEKKDFDNERAETILQFQLVNIYENQKDYKRAGNLLEDIVESNPDNVNAKYYLATVYERQKKYDRADPLFEAVIKEDPKNAGALNYFGYTLADRGVRLEEALQYVQQALIIDPENGAYLDSLGWAYFKMNDLENAEIYLLKADQRVEDDPVIDDHLGDLYYKTRDFEKARDYWMRSVRIGTEPEDIEKVRKKLEMLQKKLKEQK